MNRIALVAALALVACHSSPSNPCTGWSQWSQSSSHAGQVCVAAQAPARILTTLTVDPFAAAKTLFEGDLRVHYQVPLVVGDDVYTLHKFGSFNPGCAASPDGSEVACHAWDSMIWTEDRYSWSGSKLAFQWSAGTDWKPVPSEVAGAEPLFQPVVVGDNLYLPAAGGSLFKVDRHDGTAGARIQPFATTRSTGFDPNLYVVGPLVADAAGNVYYNAIYFDPIAPLGADAKAWLVRVAPNDSVTTVSYDKLVTGAPTGTNCHGTFSAMMPRPARPWPPPPNPDGSPVLPPLVDCGSQRPGINNAPAVGADGSVFVVSRAHHSSQDSFLVALNPNLSTRWVTSLRGILNDGCGIKLPSDGDPMNAPFDCRPGAITGVNPSTNQMPAGRIIDESSSSPVALPDGAVLYGTYSAYNDDRGHLVKFDPAGKPIGTYDFGWDYTPAVWQHDGTYSIIVKDNHYTFDANGTPTGPYYITQLDSNLAVQWQFKSTNTKSCTYDSHHALHCVDDHPNGFEWCINAPAVDAQGTVYAGGEDGVVYAIGQGGVDKGHLFLSMSLGASYTPLSIDHAGRVYEQNDGLLSVVGN